MAPAQPSGPDALFQEDIPLSSCTFPAPGGTVVGAPGIFHPAARLTRSTSGAVSNETRYANEAHFHIRTDLNDLSYRFCMQMKAMAISIIFPGTRGGI